MDITRPVTINGGNNLLNGKLTVSGNDVVINNVKVNDKISVTGNNITLNEIEISDAVSTKASASEKPFERMLNIAGNGNVTVKNSIFNGSTNIDNGIFRNAIWIEGTNADRKINIEGNTFNNCSNVYNTVEFGQDYPVSGNVTIKGNHFAGDSKNNSISMFTFTNGADITIEDNVFDMSANAVRLSNYTNVNATFNIKNNTFKDSSENDYAGFLLMQEVKNESFSGFTFNVENLIGPNGLQVTAESTGKDRFCYYYSDHGENHVLPESDYATVNYI